MGAKPRRVMDAGAHGLVGLSTLRRGGGNIEPMRDKEVKNDSRRRRV